MDEAGIIITGLDETIEMLDKAPRNIVKSAYAKALTAAAATVVKALEPRVPIHTGDLAAHVVTDVAVDSQGHGGYAQIGFGKEGYKARLAEYGHREIGHKPKNKDEGQVQAHPFMRPAAAESADAAVEAFADSLRESLAAGEIPNTRTAA